MRGEDVSEVVADSTVGPIEPTKVSLLLKSSTNLVDLLVRFDMCPLAELAVAEPWLG